MAAYPELGNRVAAVVSLAGAVNGSPLSDDAPRAMLSLLEHVPGAECEPGDSGALDSLARTERFRFNVAHDLPESVQYYSLVAFTDREHISSILRGSYDRLAQVDPRNDSQVLFYDQIVPKSRLLGYLDADHWAVALPIARLHPTLAALLVDRNAFPREVLLEAIMRHVEEQLGADTPAVTRSAGDARAPTS